MPAINPSSPHKKDPPPMSFLPTSRATAFGLISLLVLATVPIPIIISLCLITGFNPFTVSF